MIKWLRKWATWLSQRAFCKEYCIHMQDQKNLNTHKVVWIAAFNASIAVEKAKAYRYTEDGGDFRVTKIVRL